MKRGGLQTKHACRLVVPGLTHSLRVLWTLAPQVQVIATQHRAAGMCSSAGEKVTAVRQASWSVLIKSGLEQTGLAGEWWQQQQQRWRLVLRKKKGQSGS